MDIIQPIGLQVTLGSATTLDGARYISVYNSGGMGTVLIKNPDNGETIASVSMAPGERLTIVKFHKYTLEATASFLAVPLVRTQ